MSLILKCPCCGGHTTSHIEFNNGYARNIYNCLNCSWTNRYYQIADNISTTPLSNHPSNNYTTAINTYIDGTYLITNTTISKGGLQNAK